MTDIYVALNQSDETIFCVTDENKRDMIKSGLHDNTIFYKLTRDDHKYLKKRILEGKTVLKEGECPPDKERSLKTNRCVKKCKSDQKRNPVSGRCKKVGKVSRVKSEKRVATNIMSKVIGTNLPVIYLDNDQRAILSRNIKQRLVEVHKIPVGKQCVMSQGKNQLADYLTVGKLLGTGDWGNVYTGCIPDEKSKECNTDSFRFAIKMARITPENLKTPYNPNEAAWHEVIIMKDILTPIVKTSMCPNVPLLMDSFICDNCSFIFNNDREEHPCIIMVTELAGGDFNHFVDKTSPNEDELYSALFQIMAGLHAIQSFGQIMNYDIKGANILYFNVKPGGYWHYVIHGVDFYVPNYGKLFILNDFGVSQTFSPDFQMSLSKKDKKFELGSRYAMDIDGIFSPIEAKYTFGEKIPANTVTWVSELGREFTSNGSEYMLKKDTQKIMDSVTTLTQEQKNYLKKHDLSTDPLDRSYFLQPLVIPPMEYYNDTQDAIRMFVGGDRTTQRGTHRKPKVVTGDQFRNINRYKRSARQAGDNDFSVYAYKSLAGRFIQSFFVDMKDYTKPLSGIKYGDYIMSRY